MDAHRRRQLMTFPRDARISSDQVEDREEFLVVSFRLNRTKHAHTFLGNADNIIFRRQ